MGGRAGPRRQCAELDALGRRAAELVPGPVAQRIDDDLHAEYRTGVQEGLAMLSFGWLHALQQARR